ncbi:MAG: DNA-3-methyladenine glycosylase 2 [Clostridia bacterium]|nr:DNA-3-methyladenine glycosylase 2 [Clostridia bacterium]
MERQFDAVLTLMDSAQVFHFQNINGVYAAAVGGRVLTDRDDDPFARDYFDDERDYSHLLDACGEFEIARRALLMLPGLRVLNQPPWEALIQFILSANNNVKRIRTLVNDLCRHYGEEFEYDGVKLYGFPSPDTLSKLDEEKLRQNVTCGYRAKYLIGTAKMIKDGFPLDFLRFRPHEEARKMLMTLPGVGGKVADCVLLFGLRHASSFPVDVWVERLMENWFHISSSREKMRLEAIRILGSECGLIQQALFHAARTGLIDIENKG